MLNFDDILKNWHNLSKVQQFEILSFVTALLTDNKTVPQSMLDELEKRLERYKSSQDEVSSWGSIFNQLINELV